MDQRNLLAIVTLLCAGTALAHHSYAMFDMRKSLVVEGSIAKFEWTNPHAFAWLYVKKADKPGEYNLFAFESDTPNQLKLNGWSRGSLKAGDKVSIRYFPLRDGRPGGRLIQVRRGDGSVLTGARETFGVREELQRLDKESTASPAAPQPRHGK
jgi:hypothetical protein